MTLEITQHPATVELARDERLFLGASWYPEMWPEAEWPEDVRRMREVGFNIVRVFEFAWSRMEPREGEFDFAWARRIMDLCHEAGIAVMVGTPTAAPPAWLTSKYPDVLQTDASGRRAGHGRRKHYNVHSETYRELSRRITRAMAENFSDHPALHSWQIDNEMGGFDYGPETKAKLHSWLARRYGTIEELNTTWGLNFWSQWYDSFAQIPLVTASVGSTEVPERHHPSLIMATARFQNDGWTTFIGEQCSIIREAGARKGAVKPITTNMVPGLAMHWYQHNLLLDRVGFSMYHDLEHYHWQLYRYDRMRSEKVGPNGEPVPYWLLETAPSWSAGGRIWNIHHDAAGIRAKTWASMIFGGSMMLYWQWREHWAGQEMQHGTIVTATGKWRPNKEAFEQMSREFEQHGPWLLAHPPAPAELAIILSNENAWAFSIDPVSDDLRYEVRWRDQYYLPLVQQHLWRDVIPETRDFSPYRVIVLPLMPIIAPQTRHRLAEWVSGGGRLLLGPLTGYRTEEFTAFTDLEFGGLESLIGAESSMRFTPHWVEDRIQVEFADGQTTRTRDWCEGFSPTTGTALAHYRGGYGDGHAAIIRHSYGSGEVITLGCPVDEPTYLRLVMQMCEATGIRPLAQGSSAAAVVPRADATGKLAAYAVVNLREQPETITLSQAGTDLLTGDEVGPDVSLAAMQVRLVRVAE